MVLLHTVIAGAEPTKQRGRQPQTNPLTAPRAAAAAARRPRSQPARRQSAAWGNARELERRALRQREEPRTLAGEARKQIGSTNVALGAIRLELLLTLGGQTATQVAHGVLHWVASRTPQFCGRIPTDAATDKRDRI